MMNGDLAIDKEDDVEVEILDQHRKRSYQPHLFKQPPSCNIDIAFENISLQAPSSTFTRSKKQILNGVSGLFKSGELTAIMGPSGAGKTSLLNVLSGFIKEGVGGNIFANGLLEDKMRRLIKEFSVYILQDDYLLPCFTVSEIMMHATNVKLGRSISTEAKCLLIDNILESMSLSESKKTRCNRLSGGEKKRLNVCLELIGNPPILFLDEPTSGLDSSSCGLLVSELKGLAQGGRTVICTIHQPSAAVLYMFDHLYVLAKGQVVYQGDTSKLLSFLDHIGLPCPIFHNPADYIMDVAIGEFGSYTDKFAAAMRSRKWRTDTDIAGANSNKKQITPNDYFISGLITSKFQRPSEWEKFMYMVPQLIKQLHRDWVITYLKVLLNCLTGVLVGLMFTDTGNTAIKIFPTLGYVFASLAYFCFTSLMPAALRFPGEMGILRKEHFNNWYKFTTFYLAFLVVNIPLQVFLALFYVGPSYLLTGQVLEVKRFLVFYAVNINSSIISLILGLYMGTLGPVYGVFGGSILIIVMTVLGGFIALINDFPTVLYIISFLSFLRHSFEVVITGLYGMGRGNLPCPQQAIYCHYKNPETVFKDTGLDPANLIRDVIILILLTSSASIITFFKLRAALKNFK